MHFAISSSLHNKKNFTHDLKFAENLFNFCKKNKIVCYYISSISAFRENKSLYSKLKIKIEDIANSKNIKIIRPGMIWGYKPMSWFGNINIIIEKCIFFVPMIGAGDRHIYMANINNFMDALLKIFKLKDCNKFVIFNKDTINFKLLVKKICKKKKKKNILIPIPIFLIFKIFRLLYTFKILSSSTYDSLQSYKYAKKHTFAGYKVINTIKSFNKY